MSCTVREISSFPLFFPFSPRSSPSPHALTPSFLSSLIYILFSATADCHQNSRWTDTEYLQHGETSCRFRLGAFCVCNHRTFLSIPYFCHPLLLFSSFFILSYLTSFIIGRSVVRSFQYLSPPALPPTATRTCSPSATPSSAPLSSSTTSKTSLRGWALPFNVQV